MGRVERALGAKEYANEAFLDIEGAFNSTSNVAIKQAMIRHEIPEALMDWTENMLAGRNLIFYHRERTTEGTPDRGYPQEGVLSPLLRCLIANDLLKDLQREGFHIYGYADNIAIVSGGRFLSALRNLIKQALKMTNRWCKTKCLVVNPQNTNVMIFIRKYKPEPIKPLRIKGEEITFTKNSEIPRSLIKP